MDYSIGQNKWLIVKKIHNAKYCCLQDGKSRQKNLVGQKNWLVKQNNRLVTQKNWWVMQNNWLVSQKNQWKQWFTHNSALTAFV